MKKNWNSPAIEELNITETALTNSSGTEVDGGTWDNTTGEITRYYYASGEHGNYDHDVN